MHMGSQTSKRALHICVFTVNVITFFCCAVILKAKATTDKKTTEINLTFVDNENTTVAENDPASRNSSK